LIVSQELEDGTKIAIAKGKGTNTYYLGDKSYSKVGRDIPEDVLSLLRTQVLPLDKDQSLDLNFMRQFDTPFLLSDSTSIITKAISSLSGINIIYSAVREGMADLQKLKSKSEVLRGTISDLLKYDELSEAGTALLALVEKVKAYQSALAVARTDLDKRYKLRDDLELLEGREVDLAPFGKSCDEVLSAFSKATTLRSSVAKMESVRDRLSGIPDYVVSDGFLDDLTFFEGSINSLNYAFDIGVGKKSKLDKMSELLGLIGECSSKEANIAKLLEEGGSEITRLEKQVKVCPTCSRPF